MWENEFVEEMAKTEHGNMSKQEASKKWEEMKNAPGAKKDNNGPRGALRLKVAIGDYESSFSEFGDEEEQEALGPVKKKATDEDFRKAGEELMTKGTRSMFLASDDDESSDPDRTSHVAFRKALERKTGPSIMTSTNLGAASSFAPSLTPGKKKKKKGASSSSAGEDEDVAGANAEVEATKDKKEDEKDEWFDIDTALPKASRKLFNKISEMRINLQIQVEQADAAVMAFSTESSDAQNACSVEQGVVMSRLEAARVVLSAASSADDAKVDMDTFLAKFGRGGSASEVGSSLSPPGQTYQESLARCGPCPGFQNLKAIPWMLGQAKQLKDTSASENARFSSRDALQAYVDSFELPSKAILELGKALRISCDQLYQAKMDFASLAASAATLRKKAAEKRSAADNAAEAKKTKIARKQDDSRSNGCLSALFEAKIFENGQRLAPSVDNEKVNSQPSQVDWTQPFFVSSDDVEVLLGSITSDDILEKESKEAAASFLVSEERRQPSKGKGKIALMDGSLKTRISTAIKDAFKMPPSSFFELGAEEAKAQPKLVAMLEPDLFVTKSEKVHAVVENASLPTIRWVRSGVRQIIMMKFAHIAEHVRSKLGGSALKQPLSSLGTFQWLTNCGHEKLTEFVESNPSAGVFRNSLGPGDMLYTPPGWIKFEMGNEDSIVVRMALVPVKSLPDFISDFRISAADLLAQGRKNATLDFMLAVAGKQTNNTESVPKEVLKIPDVQVAEDEAKKKEDAEREERNAAEELQRKHDEDKKREVEERKAAEELQRKHDEDKKREDEERKAAEELQRKHDEDKKSGDEERKAVDESGEPSDKRQKLLQEGGEQKTANGVAQGAAADAAAVAT